MLIQDAASVLFKDIISWVAALIHILIIVKLIVLLSKAFKGGLGGGSSKKKPEGGDYDKGDDPNKVKDEVEKQKDAWRKADLDPDNMGRIVFYTVDENGNPLMRVRVAFWPSNRTTWARITRKKIRNKHAGETLPNGFSPNEFQLPAGMWRYKAKKRGWIPATKNNEFSIKPDSQDASSKELQRITIPLKRRKNHEDGFSPVILDVQPLKDKKKRNRAKLEGIIN
jgi:hypothetical protein